MGMGWADSCLQAQLLACLFGLKVCLTATELATQTPVRKGMVPSVPCSPERYAESMVPSVQRLCTFQASGRHTCIQKK